MLNAWQGLPRVTLPSLPPIGRALVIAPHPDDESLGCGGLIAALCAAGTPPLVAILTDGSASHLTADEASRAELARIRAAEARQATACLGLPAHHLHMFGFRDAALRQVQEPCSLLLTQLARNWGCHAVIATCWHDPHDDHQAAAAIAVQVADRIGAQRLFYPTWAWTMPPDATVPQDQVAGWRLDIAAHLPEKRRAIVAHESQYFGLAGDPDRSCLPAELLAVCTRPYEVLLTG